MSCIRRRVLFIGFALSALGASVIAISGDASLERMAGQRPVAVSPEAEGPTAAEFERRSLAIPQPTGKRTPGQSAVSPQRANPQR